MRKSAIIMLLAALFGLQPTTRADEGMWLPLLIKRLNYGDMQKMGLKLTPEEIYSVNQSSLKDAIVVLNGGSCTAEMISSQGLMLTNHHCAYGVIQENSTEKSNYLDNGFFAMKKTDELSAKGMTAGFLVRMEDVTQKVNAKLKSGMSEQERAVAIRKVFAELEEEAVKDTHYEARTKSFFEGNQFFLFVYEVFRDVRLVAAPPESVGKFGGDTDNWMWPRQTGDFSMLRVYSGSDGKPADYSTDNVPLKPRHHLPVSMNGVKKNDFAMVMGYPGSTDRFLTSYGVKLAVEKDQPSIVKIREKRLDLLKQDMDLSPKVRLQYASKYARVSNYYKYFKGQIRGLTRLKVYDQKKAEEDALAAWIAKDGKRKDTYGECISLLETGYNDLDKYKLAQTYLNEALFGPEVVLFAWRANSLYAAVSAEEIDPIKKDQAIQLYKQQAADFFKDYNAPTDQKVFAALLEMYYNDIDKEFHADVFEMIQKKYKGDFDKFAAYVFSKSIFVNQEKLNEFLLDPKAKTMEKDPAFMAVNSFIDHYRANVSNNLRDIYGRIDKGNRLLVKGLMESNPDKTYYPNANSTMRLTYGKVLDYFPRDAVYYNYYTTLAGVMEKEDPNNPEFIVPEKIKELYKAKDFGPYAENGEMHVCFITNNDITGGNSGSPVINGKGELIGCAFDGNWEAMSGDIAFEQQLQRCIVVDIRYVLFIIDKVAGAKHLVDEMTLVKDEPKAESKPQLQDTEAN